MSCKIVLGNEVKPCPNEGPACPGCSEQVHYAMMTTLRNCGLYDLADELEITFRIMFRKGENND